MSASFKYDPAVGLSSNRKTSSLDRSQIAGHQGLARSGVFLAALLSLTSGCDKTSVTQKESDIAHQPNSPTVMTEHPVTAEPSTEVIYEAIPLPIKELSFTSSFRSRESRSQEDEMNEMTTRKLSVAFENLSKDFEGKGEEVQKLVGEVKELRGKITENELEEQATSVKIEELTKAFEKADQKSTELSSRVDIQVYVDCIDVYNDGSWGQDKWTLSLYINGEKHQIWKEKEEISDNGDEKYGRGPAGDKDCTRYKVGKTFRVSQNPNETLVLSVEGVAHDKDQILPVARDSYTLAQGWGVQSKGGNQRMGAAVPEKLEYNVYYKIRAGSK